MEVSCPACAARYTADDDKLRGKTARMRCKACGSVWLVSGPDATAQVASSASSAAPAAPVSLAPSSKDVAKESKEESKRAAVIKKGAEREKRDIFGQPADVNGSVKQTLLPPPAFKFQAGARNESSVLFRVDQLKASAALATPPPEKAPTIDKSDDEGIIDLKALSSVPPALRPAPLPVAPLFSEPPAVTLEVDETQAASAVKRKSRWRLVGGLAAAALVIVGVGLGVSVLFKGEEPAVQPVAAAQAPEPKPEAAPPPKVDPIPAADDAKKSSDSDDEAASTKDAKGKKNGKKIKKGKGGGNRTAAPTAKPKKPADPCGCKGDFNCILACTARGGK